MTITHIEVVDAKKISNIKAGQMLKIIRETACFFWVESFDGKHFQVSKKTKRINGGKSFFIRTGNQPTVNL